MSFFEIKVRNRVVKGGLKPTPRSRFEDPDSCRPPALGVRKFLRIKGIQGNWYEETLYCLADSESEARQLATEELAKRPILGIPRNTRRRIERQVEVLHVRRLS